MATYRDQYGRVVGTISDTPNYLGDRQIRDIYGNVTGTIGPTTHGQTPVRDIYGNVTGYWSR
jgi:hypothetical protein